MGDNKLRNRGKSLQYFAQISPEIRPRHPISAPPEAAQATQHPISSILKLSEASSIQSNTANSRWRFSGGSYISLCDGSRLFPPLVPFSRCYPGPRLAPSGQSAIGHSALSASDRTAVRGVPGVSSCAPRRPAVAPQIDLYIVGGPPAGRSGPPFIWPGPPTIG